MIRRLASRELQKRYVVQGTKDEYLLPEELVYDAFKLLEDVNAGRCGCDLTNAQLAAFRDFAVVLEANEDVVRDSISNTDLIQSNLQWNTIRVAANRLLAVLEAS